MTICIVDYLAEIVYIIIKQGSLGCQLERICWGKIPFQSAAIIYSVKGSASPPDNRSFVWIESCYFFTLRKLPEFGPIGGDRLVSTDL